MFSLLVRAMASGDVKAPGEMRGQARATLRAAVEEAAQNILAKGRADIAGAGNFGGRWTAGLKAAVTDSESEVTLTVTHDVPYWTVFQNGKTILGKPLLFFAPTKPPAGLRPGAPLPPVIAKKSVTIPKKFHLVEIAKEEADKVPSIFKQMMAQKAQV